MKKFLLLVSTFLMSFVVANAQDVLTKQTGEQINVLIKEIDANNVKYVLFSEPDGVVYTMPKSEILMIRYASGRNEIFSQTQTTANKSPYPYYVDYGGANIITVGMKYKELKNIYDFGDWHGGYEKYSPFWCGFGSFFIPGLGQMCAGEGLRGLGHVGINVGLSILSTGFLANDQVGAYILTEIARFGLNIWSIIDASRVAKVKNMYYTDLRSQYSDISVDMYPSLIPTYSQSGLSTVPSMTFAISF